MNIFNSLGSNYTLTYVLTSLLQQEKGAKKHLDFFLAKKYNGNVQLFYKARQAITEALILSRLPNNAKVAVTGFTCIAVVTAIKNASLTPVFVDINPKTLNFSAESLEAALTKDKSIKAVIIQNTLGNPCDIEEIQKICKKNKLILLEDIAHAVGTFYANKKEAGMVGDFVILSFSQDKIIDGVSGGALIIKDLHTIKQQIPEKNQNPSFQDKYYPLFTFLIRTFYPFYIGKLLHAFLKTSHLLSNPMKTSKKNLTDWHANIILEEFRKLDANISHRKKIAEIYTKNLPEKYISKNIHPTLRYPIFVANRKSLILHLQKKGVYISDIWYDAPIAPAKDFSNSGYVIGDCKNAEKISETILNLPTHKNISENDAVKICELIKLWEK